jgi:hypothetical protein
LVAARKAELAESVDKLITNMDSILGKVTESSAMLAERREVAKLKDLFQATKTKLEELSAQVVAGVAGSEQLEHSLRDAIEDFRREVQQSAERPVQDVNAKVVESLLQQVAELRKASEHGEKFAQEKQEGMKQDLEKRIQTDLKDVVKKEEFNEALQQINQERLKEMIDDAVNSAMHSICAQEGSNSVKEFLPTRPEMIGGDDDQEEETPREEILKQVFDPPKQFRVVHKDLVYVQEDHSADSAVLGYKSCGEVVLATCEVNDWLKLADEEGWMLRDGRTLGQGVLLEADVQ